MNTNLIHKWLRDPKFAPDPEVVEEQIAETPCFLPVEIVDGPETNDMAPKTDTKPAQSAIEIDIAGGHQLRIVGSYDPEALAGAWLADANASGAESERTLVVL